MAAVAVRLLLCDVVNESRLPDIHLHLHAGEARKIVRRLDVGDMPLPRLAHHLAPRRLLVVREISHLFLLRSGAAEVLASTEEIENILVKIASLALGHALYPAELRPLVVIMILATG